MMKKILSILLIICCMGSILLSVSATTGYAEVSSATASQGKTVDITVNLSDVGEIKSGGITVIFDTADLILQKAKWNLPSALISDFDIKNNRGVFAFASAEKIKGSVLQMTFLIKENAEKSDYDIQCEVLLKDATHKQIPCSSKAGHIHIEKAHIHQFTEEIPKPQYLKSPATCTESAVYYKSCSCGAMGEETFSYGEPSGHRFSTRWSADGTYHWHECEVCKVRMDMTIHTSSGKATESSPEVCIVCGYVLNPPLNHTHKPILVPENKATCTEDGNIAYYRCEGCNHIFRDIDCQKEISLQDTVIPAAGHSPSEWIIEHEPLPGKEGKRYKLCIVCHQRLQEESIPALPPETTAVTTESIPAETVQTEISTGETTIFDTTAPMTEASDPIPAPSETEKDTASGDRNSISTVGLILIIMTGIILLVIPVIGVIVYHKNKK